MILAIIHLSKHGYISHSFSYFFYIFRKLASQVMHGMDHDDIIYVNEVVVDHFRLYNIDHVNDTRITIKRQHPDIFLS